MPRREVAPLVPLLHAEDVSGKPLYLQIYERIRDLVLSGALAVGDRLPASRTLARDLGVSRSTVELAFEQLLTEGFIERRAGSGTYVAAIVRERSEPLRGSQSERNVRESTPPGASLSRRGQRMMDIPCGAEEGTPSGFMPCMPSLDGFPLDVWNRLLARKARTAGTALFEAGGVAGDPNLREAIAHHVNATRSLRCDREQVVVVASTQQALDIAARLLLDPGDAVWLEEPGYLGARAAFLHAGAKVVPVLVDGDGIHVPTGRQAAPEARLAYVTPSHQYPTGHTLSIARRLDLMAWAEEAGAWIIEDDYDSEFRYEGRPLAALQSIDDAGRTIYIGTFNKVLFTTLRLAYLVVPEVLVEPFRKARMVAAGLMPALTQAVLADFMREGHFASHIRRMRSLYRARRDALVEAVREALGDRMTLGPHTTGLHVVGYVPDGQDDRKLSSRAAAVGLHVPPLSACCIEAPRRRGLILGYAHVDATAIREGVRRLASVLDPAQGPEVVW